MVAVNISVYPGDIQVVRQCHICHMRPVLSRYQLGGHLGSPGFLPPPVTDSEVGHTVKTLTILTSAGAGAADALLGAGIAAAAPDVVGQTYGDANPTIQRAGGTPVVATRVGSLADEENAS